ncbi:hypothetical protein JG688_00013808 [Phytophthora aleatoria]|uniref:Uncharacterized protein n=1 Tax=Phytophthora aleatoria TaxID=2496075 RepID=A0A8J5ICX1_9STRA|nr:hypothetical protein JG688_00013808 [Phytophthora aleatoria]
MAEAKEMSTAQATAVTSRALVAASACTDTPATEARPADEDVFGDGGHLEYEIPACIIDADPNLMARGADQCPCLNYDEDPETCEEPEAEEDESGDSDS